MFKQTKNTINRFLTTHRDMATTGLKVAHSIHNFALTKSPLSFIEGGVQFVLGLCDTSFAYSHQFFNPENGWYKILSAHSEKPLYDMFKPLLQFFEHNKLSFKFDQEQYIGTYIFNNGQTIGLDRWGIWARDISKKDEILNYFIDKKMGQITSNCFSLTNSLYENDKQSSEPLPYDLINETMRSIPSSLSKYHVDNLKLFIDKNISRSVIFNGMPGTGKTTLAHTILSELNFRTLKFKYDRNIGLHTIQFLVKALHVDAILIDDFDHTVNTNVLLEFLEWMHDNTKIVIAITNSLKNLHPAILRPGRFDYIVRIDHLDDDIVKNILEEKYHYLLDTINTWPVSFINELNHRLRVNPNIIIDTNIAELQSRVAKQIALLQ